MRLVGSPKERAGPFGLGFSESGLFKSQSDEVVLAGYNSVCNCNPLRVESPEHTGPANENH